MKPLTIALTTALTLISCVLLWAFTNALSWLNGSTFDVAVAITCIVIGVAAVWGSIRPLRRLFAWSQGRGKDATVLLLALAASQSTGCGCERIDAGNVGIKIELAGSNRGVQHVPIVTGWVFYNKFTAKVLEYPTYVQTAVWAASKTEREPNEEMSFNSKDGLTFTGDISLSYQLAASAVPAFYVKFRSDDLATFTHGYLRNVARDQFNEVAGTYAPEELYGPKKEEFLRTVRERVNRELAPVGVRLEQLGFVGAPRPPQNVISAINAKIAATQQAMQVENEVRATEAQAKKNVAQAEGDARAKIAAAEGAASAKLKLAEAEAKANKMLSESLSPALLQWRQLEVNGQAVQRWDGKRPTVEGSNGGLLLQLPVK